MEKKKLLLVAISVGVFLVLTISAAILVFTPQKNNLPFETIASNTNLEPVNFFPVSTYQSPIAVGEQQPSSIDAVDLVRNPGGVPGLVTPPEGVVSQANETGKGTENVISVTQPTTAAVPSTPPTGRAANQSTPATTVRPAQTTTTPAQTTTGASQTPSTTAQTTTGASQTPTPSTTAKATTPPAQTTTSSSQTPSTTAQTTTGPSQTASTQVQTTTTPAQTTPPASTVPITSQSIPAAAQTRIYDDFWVQTGAFSTVASAEGVKETLASKGITSIIENGNVNGRTLFRVRVGPYTSQNEANFWLALIKSIDGFEDSQVRQTQNLR